MNFFKTPSYVLLITLSLIYFGAGYLLGFYQGYSSGQKDYMFYVNKLFDGVSP